MNRLKNIRLFLSNDYLALVLRLFLGFTFIVSSITKLSHHTEFVEVVKEYDLLPNALASVYGNTLPWVELIIGVYLIMAIMVRLSVIVTLLMEISFMIANVTAMARGKEHCGDCFGDLATLPIDQAIIIDIFLLIASLTLLFFKSERHLIGLHYIFSKKEAASIENEPD